MAFLASLKDVLQTGCIGPLRSENTAIDVADLLGPPGAWAIVPGDLFPSLWCYDGGEIAFSSQAPHGMEYIKLYTDHFDGSAVVFANSDRGGHRTTLLSLDGIHYKSRPTDFIRMLSDVGASIECEFMNVTSDITLNINIGKHAYVGFTVDGEGLEAQQGGDRLVVDPGNDALLRQIDEEADLFAIYIRGDPTDDTETGMQSKFEQGRTFVSGDEFLRVCNKIGADS